MDADLTTTLACSQACAGDSTETCGGEAVISVYATDTDAPPSLVTPPQPATTSGSSQHERYVHRGCVTNHVRHGAPNQSLFRKFPLPFLTCVR